MNELGVRTITAVLLIAAALIALVDKNRVAGTRSDAATGDRTRAGYGLEVSFGAEAEVGRNDLARNPARVGVFLGSLVTRMDS